MCGIYYLFLFPICIEMFRVECSPFLFLNYIHFETRMNGIISFLLSDVFLLTL